MFQRRWISDKKASASSGSSSSASPTSDRRSDQQDTHLSPKQASSSTSGSSMPTTTKGQRGGEEVTYGSRGIGHVSLDGEFVITPADLEKFKDLALQDAAVKGKLEKALHRVVADEKEKLLYATNDESEERQQQKRFGYYFDHFILNKVMPFLRRKGWDQHQWVLFSNQVILQLREGQEAHRSHAELRAKDAIDRQCQIVLQECQQLISQQEAELTKVYDREPRSRNFDDKGERDLAIDQWKAYELDPAEHRLEESKARYVLKKLETECRRNELLAHQRKAEYYQSGQFVAKYLWHLIALACSMLVMGYSSYWAGRRMPRNFEAGFRQLQEDAKESRRAQEVFFQEDGRRQAAEMASLREKCRAKDELLLALEGKVKDLEVQLEVTKKLQEESKKATVVQLQSSKKPWWKFW